MEKRPQHGLERTRKEDLVGCRSIPFQEGMVGVNARYRRGISALALAGTLTAGALAFGLGQAAAASGPVSSTFTTGKLNTSIWTVLNPDGNLSMTKNAGWLTLPTETAPTSSWATTIHNVVLQPVSASSNWTVNVQITWFGISLGTPTAPALPTYQGGSLVAWQNYTNWMRVVDQPSTCQLMLQWETNGTMALGAGSASSVNETTLSAAACNSADYPMWLRLTKDGTTYSGYYSTNGSTWNLIGIEADSTLQVADVGVYAGQGGGTKTPSDAGFRDFTVGTGTLSATSTAASSTSTSATTSSSTSTTTTSSTSKATTASSSTAATTTSSSAASSSTSKTSIPKTGEGPLVPLAGALTLLAGVGLLLRRGRRAQG